MMDKEKSSTSLNTNLQQLKQQNNEKDQHIQSLLRNINVQKLAEADIRLLNTALEEKVVKRTAQYAFISQVNQVIVQAKDAKTLFEKPIKEQFSIYMLSSSVDPADINRAPLNPLIVDLIEKPLNKGTPNKIFG
ncbi:hypothetical protein [Flavobacterium sp. UBA7682]|uniref:hypothetical protein n=1 Tax=Flavobacterium sp. UBA7682 TaxID=1946560 RepID=UPI0025B8EF70|nr:hypothetical protein [Flavobacterium sp. UBA7682]